MLMNRSSHPFQQQRELCRMPNIGEDAGIGSVFESLSGRKSSTESDFDVFHVSFIEIEFFDRDEIGYRVSCPKSIQGSICPGRNPVLNWSIEGADTSVLLESVRGASPVWYNGEEITYRQPNPGFSESQNSLSLSRRNLKKIEVMQHDTSGY